MTYNLEILNVVEFKNYNIDGPLVDQIFATSIRAQARNKPAKLIDVYIFCRGFSKDARKRALELEKIENIRVNFKVVSPEDFS